MSIVTEPGLTLFREYEDFIDRTARSIAYSFAKVEYEDVRQEMWVFLWEKEALLLENNASEPYVKTCLRNTAKNYALRMRDNTLSETDRFYYSIDEVKELLPTFFSLPEDWQQSGTLEGGQSYDSREALATFCDLSLAYGRLTDAQQEVLYRRYALDEEFSEAKDRQQASRAVKRLWSHLNVNTDKRAKAYTGPGCREAMTNARGIHLARAGVEA